MKPNEMRIEWEIIMNDQNKLRMNELNFGEVYL